MKPSITIILLAVLMICSMANAETVISYDWLTLGKKSGEQIVTRQDDGSISIQFGFNDRGRGPKTTETIQLNSDGLMREYRVSGNSYMGANVGEVYTLDGQNASWQSAEESGSVRVSSPAAYVAANMTPETLAILVRSALAQPEQMIDLLPSGTATVREVQRTTVSNGETEHEVRLMAVTGMGFTPNYLWMDSDNELFAVAYGWMGMTPVGWAGVIDQLQEIQDAASEEFHKQLAADLTESLTGTTLIDNVNLLNVDKGKLKKSAVLIEDGRIVAIGRKARKQEADRVIDAGGRTLMPGLWDMHTHMGMGSGLLHMAAGVTSVRDLANNHDDLMKVVAAFDSGDVIGPRIYKAGFIDQKSEYSAPTGNIAETLEDALGYVDWYAGQGYPQIKIYSSITPDWVKPIAERIHSHGMKLSGHIPSYMTAEQAVRDGYDEIQHINMLFLNFLAGPEDDTRTPVRFTLVGEKAATLDLESDAVRDFIALLRKQGTVVDPTVTIFHSMFLNRAGEIDPGYAAVADHMPANVRRGFLGADLEIDDSNATQYVASAQALLDMIGMLHHSGVQLVAGTDAIAGFTLHRELELYVKAGISNEDVIRIATIESAEVAGAADETGSIEVGKQAELILVDGNPLEDISAIRRVVWSIKGGKRYDASALYTALGIKPFVQ